MSVMAKKATKKATTAKTYPSRENIKYVPVTRADWDALKALGDADQRSVAFMTKKAIRFFLEQQKK
jgi:hypothetical protein